MATVEDEFEGLEYELLQEYIENGRTATMPSEMLTYLEQLEAVRGFHIRQKSTTFILNYLKDNYGLSDYLARKRHSDALNFFYLSNEVKKDAWRNIYAEKLEKAAELTLATAKTSKDLDVYKNIILAAANMRQLNEKEPEKLPEGLYTKPIKIYETTVERLGLPKADRKTLARQIDAFEIPETERLRIKRDAQIEDTKIFPDHEESPPE